MHTINTVLTIAFRDITKLLRDRSRISPMTYAVDLMRSIYYLGKPEYTKVVLFNPILDVSIVLGFGLIFLLIGTFVFVRNERNR